MNGWRDRSLQARQCGLDRFDRVDDVDARNLEYDEKDAALAVRPPSLRRVGRPHDGLADVSNADGGPVSIGDDDVVPRLGRRQLIVVIDRKGLFVSQDRALGAVYGRDADLRPHVLELEAHLDKFGWINLDAYGWRHLAADAHERDARDLAEVLGEDILRRVVHVDDRRDVRLNGQDEDRRVGRVDLAVGRRARQVFRQLP